MKENKHAGGPAGGNMYKIKIIGAILFFIAAVCGLCCIVLAGAI